MVGTFCVLLDKALRPGPRLVVQVPVEGGAENETLGAWRAEAVNVGDEDQQANQLLVLVIPNSPACFTALIKSPPAFARAMASALEDWACSRKDEKSGVLIGMFHRACYRCRFGAGSPCGCPPRAERRRHNPLSEKTSFWRRVSRPPSSFPATAHRCHRSNGCRSASIRLRSGARWPPRSQETVSSFRG